MSSELSFRDAGAMLEGAREARLQLCVFHHDAQVPGEVAALSRLLFRHVPELAKRSGFEIAENEGYPPAILATDEGLVRMIAADMSQGREMVAWLAPVTSDLTKAMFAYGRDNAMDAVLQRTADDAGLTRTDVLAKEAEAPRSRSVMAAITAGVTAGRE